MRIGFDARMVAHSGIGTYSREILNRLTAGDAFDFTLFGDPAKIGDFMALKVRCDYPIYSLKEQLLLSNLMARHAFDLAHFPHYNAPLGYRKPFVVTVHDCIHLIYPKSRLAYLYAKTLIQSACRKSRIVITDSQHTKNDLMRLLGLPENKIRVIHPGVSERWRTQADEARKNRASAGPMFAGEYALYVGNVRSSKNIENLMRAYEKASEGRKLRLILAGKNFMPDWTARFKGRDDVLFLGEVSDPTLVRLYANAKLFIFPSLYEGFGLPPLEAMASGVPVICSNAASLPEVAGDAALLFDPRDVSTLAAHILKLWDDAALRNALIEKGYANAARFSWNKCAEEVAGVYREALR